MLWDLKVVDRMEDLRRTGARLLMKMCQTVDSMKLMPLVDANAYTISTFQPMLRERLMLNMLLCSIIASIFIFHTGMICWLYGFIEIQGNYSLYFNIFHNIQILNKYMQLFFCFLVFFYWMNFFFSN